MRSRPHPALRLNRHGAEPMARPPLLVARKIARPEKCCFLIDWFRRARGVAPKNAPVVSYSVAINRRADEQRAEPRRRTRLRAGKILGRDNHFIADAIILDRSAGGLRLRLTAAIEPPKDFHFFDEESETIFVARLVWRKGAMIGARRGATVSAGIRQLVALRGKFYAMRD